MVDLDPNDPNTADYNNYNTVRNAIHPNTPAPVNPSEIKNGKGTHSNVNNFGGPYADPMYRYLNQDHYRSEVNDFYNFELYRRHNFDPAVSGYTYVFFSAPEMAVIKDGGIGIAHSDNIDRIFQNNAMVLKLPYDGYASIYSQHHANILGGAGGKWMPFLSNRVRSYPTEKLQLRTEDYGETYSRYKILIGSTTKESQIGGTITFKFAEDDELNITKFHKLWISYIEAQYKGDVYSWASGGLDLVTAQYSAIDYMTGITLISTKPDGSTITHWAKYTGCFPLTVPTDVFTADDGTINLAGTVDIEYAFAFKEEMDLQILRDINLMASRNYFQNIAKPGGRFADEFAIPNADFVTFTGGERTFNESFFIAKVDRKDKDKPPMYKLILRNDADPIGQLYPGAAYNTAFPDTFGR